MSADILSIIAKPAAGNNSPALSVENLHLHFGTRCVLHGLDLQLMPGSLTAVMGPNGAGKTSLLKAIMGLLTPTSGFITRKNGASVGYLPQISEFDRDFPITVSNLVQMGALPRRAKQERIMLALRQTGLESHADHYIQDLSAGQLKRALFARLIVQDSDILLLDEPFAEIDSGTTENLMQTLRAFQNSGKTVLVVLHDAALARRYFPQILLLEEGHSRLGPTAQLLAA